MKCELYLEILLINRLLGRIRFISFFKTNYLLQDKFIFVEKVIFFNLMLKITLYSILTIKFQYKCKKKNDIKRFKTGLCLIFCLILIFSLNPCQFNLVKILLNKYFKLKLAKHSFIQI